ncbi:uncharacterized protein [Asterias amurensis]|uniref:uncharacterized protein n=1 Tax=Asterias amurensis TaxID=7602 RepID=UPI003AB32D8E
MKLKNTIEFLLKIQKRGPKVSRNFRPSKMGIISIISGCFVFFWLCLPSPSECQVSQVTVSSFPVQPVENGNVTLTCSAAGFDPNAHMFTWLRSYNSSCVNVIPDHRMSFSPDNLINEIVKLYSQSLTITNLIKSDEGLYLCVIIANDTAGTLLTNGGGRLTVNSTEEFPVCFTDGPAVVNEGDILTCSTVINERTPVVSDTNSPVERPDWEINSTQAGNELGLRLQKSVQVSDDGVTFFCFSITPENQNWTSLSCKIGPLTVIPYPTTPGHSVGVIIGIAIPLILLVGLVTILVSYFVYRKRTRNTTSDTGPNQQNPSHIYATSIREDSQASSAAKAEVPNYINVNPSSSSLRGARTDLSRLVPSSNTPFNQKDVMGQAGPYMELGPQESTLDVYTELEL